MLVDIDKLIVQAAQQYMGNISRHAWKDPRVTIHIMDALQYLSQTNDTFDVIIIDLLDAWTKEALVLWAKVMQLATRVMRPNCILSTHSSADAPLHLLHRVYLMTQNFFQHVVMHKHVIRSFGNWGFVMGMYTLHM